jgi:hypothetical protein
VPSTLTIPVGSSMADAKRLLVLRSFASAGGDAERAAKQLGMDAADVRRELLAMIEDSGSASSENGRNARRPPNNTAVDLGKAKPPKRK